MCVCFATYYLAQNCAEFFLDFEHPNGQRDLFLSNGEDTITTILNTYLPTCTWKNCCITFGNTDCCLQRL